MLFTAGKPIEGGLRRCGGMRRMIASLLLALLLLEVLSSLCACNEQQFTLSPHASDGVTLMTGDPSALKIRGYRQGGKFVFSETKSLSFTAVFGAGWSFCPAYSRFFPDDPRASVTENADGSVTFAFSAEEGGHAELSELESVRVNAAAAELPQMNVYTDTGIDEVTREEWTEARFELKPGTKQFASGGFTGRGKLKGRGNSSWKFPKKPYSILLDEKHSLLDIPATRKYALIANYQDPSLMRNFITYKAFAALKGISYVPKCEFVELYINGEYNGIYLLVERIDVEKTKIDIEKADETDITGGYLIEKDAYGKTKKTDIIFECPYYANQTRDQFVLKAPEPGEGELRDAMLDYLEDYMRRVHEAIMGESGEDYLKYVDVSSWVDMIIVQEVTKNPDGNLKTSCFMYKRRGDDKLYMTAPWDFDFAYGLTAWNNRSEKHNDVFDCPTCDTAEDFITINSSCPWFDKLYDDCPAFREALRSRYREYRDTLIEELFLKIDEQAAYLSGAAPREKALWNKNFAGNIVKLRDWLERRVAWLDSVWL